MSSTVPTFDPIKYKATTREQWQAAAEAWHRWGPTLHQWLGEATNVMLDMAGVREGNVSSTLRRGRASKRL
jgi:hypothetical protein